VALVLVLVTATAGGGVIGYEVGFGDSEQAKKDAEYFRTMAEGCAVSFNDLARHSVRALYATLEAEAWLAQARAYAEALQATPTLVARAQ